jgi:hypothetical protein
VHQIDTTPPAGKPDEKKQWAWHRHPALIAAIPAVFAVIGSALTIVLGRADALPNAINPAPPPTTVLTTQTATATTTATVTETVAETPAVQITDPRSTSTLPALAPGSLAITVLMGDNGKIGPKEYRAGAIPNAVAQVLDESGHYPDTGCYPTWVLKRGSAVVKTGRSGSCRETFYLSSDSLEVRGIYHLTVSVVTDAGAKGSKTEDFKVT